MDNVNTDLAEAENVDADLVDTVNIDADLADVKTLMWTLQMQAALMQTSWMCGHGLSEHLWPQRRLSDVDSLEADLADTDGLDAALTASADVASLDVAWQPQCNFSSLGTDPTTSM